MSSDGTINHDTEEPNGLWIGLTIFAISLFIVGALVWGFFYYKVTKSNIQLSRESEYKSKQLTAQRLYEKEFLNRLEWKNKSQNQVYLPIHLAKKKALKRYQ